MEKVKVGVLGSGDVGRVLAGGFLKLGHPVRIGSRTPEKLSEWAAGAGEGASAGTFAEAAQFGDIIVLATHGMAAQNAIEMAGADSFDGKVVIDATNPLEFSSGAPQLAIGFNDSLGERVQRWLPKARVVKAFNIVGNPYMIDPQLPSGPPTMFIGGNDADAKKLVTQICEHWGWEVADLGGIEASRYLEPMCMAWVLYGVRTGKWDHAFKMLHK
jgi:predicted dinucleotide-binding enzyme